MKNPIVSLEISMYPLHEGYEAAVLQFISSLESLEGVVIQTNGMSTQVFGPIDTLMPAVQEGMKASWSDGKQSVFVMKFLLGDVHSYQHSSSK